MVEWARYEDGLAVEESIIRLLARHAPRGTLDVFASDQHGSYLKMLTKFLQRNGEDREATDEDVRAVCREFAPRLEQTPSAALFNHLAYDDADFHDLLGDDVLLIGRLESSFTEKVDDGRGQLAKLAVEPEEAAEKVDAFKTLVKLNPDHPDSWKRNRDWLADVFERARELGKPLFNETLLIQKPAESKAEMARRLPEAVVRMAEDFGRFGHFYKTQVPMLWADSADGGVELISTPDEVRSAAVTMFSAVARPMLLLSAAVDFAQYAAQYALVSDVVAGPMCGRAYFKEAFSMESSTDMESLGRNFAELALPRVHQIQDLARKVSQPWWGKFEWMSDEAEALIDRSGPRASGVRADFGY